MTIAVGTSANATYSVSSLNDAAAGTAGSGDNGHTLLASDFNGNEIDADVANNAGNSPNPNYYSPYTGANGNGTTFMISTTAGVPEPSSLALCAFAAAGTVLGAWRRYRRQKAAAIV